jgi:anti-sigma regulatory factor (Ser/Thr protein kinase)
MRELALHLLDLAENSVAADARTVSMRVEEDAACDRLRLTLVDDGRGMTPELAARVTDAFVTSRTERKVGLGLPLLKAAAEACQGELQVWSEPGIGTRVTAEFQRSHLDRMPLGDLAGTWLTLLVTHPQVHWSFEYSAGAKRFVFNDAALKHELGGVPLTDPAVLRFLRPLLVEGVAGVGRAATPPLPVGPTGEKLCQS